MVIQIECISDKFAPKLLSAPEYNTISFFTCEQCRENILFMCTYKQCAKGLRSLDEFDVKMEKERTRDKQRVR